MSECKYHEISGLDVKNDSAEGLCILHSTDPAKDTKAFTKALIIHRARHGDNFALFVFPINVAARTNCTLGSQSSTRPGPQSLIRAELSGPHSGSCANGIKLVEGPFLIDS
jgi:hypothetical protein